MFKVLLKHLIYEKCIDVFFDAVAINFLSPDDLFKRLGIKISKQSVSVPGRKIRAGWTIESSSDILDSALEGLTRAIEKEIDKEILESLVWEAMGT